MLAQAAHLDKNKKLITKLRSGKGRGGAQRYKTCSRCCQEYDERDNFNWSCRVHASQYSGSMWWCCGKAHASDAGCQQGPHEPLADPTDEDPEDAATCAARLKCICCKERGHLSEDCPQEPNIRTTWNLQGEHLRVSRIQSLRKLFAETNVATTQFLKTCVKVPKVDVVDELASDYGEKKAKEQD